MTEQKRFTLRMDGEIFENIKKQAELNKRSVAKEIEHVLEQHLKKSDKEDGKE
ncbi:Arc family DNA-binding protein [Niallia sp. RD1]|uniref:Arc family DNA-binding protein n=1 Tax=Niallia sp. RD1 TaxID=2962858 RepID=UPI0020C1B888|nr:Arc family DNA-binding protein [Niallia sp. RD1]UTI41086.1 Arc family DNA-binding protein [Niallia sp. RD1]